MPTNKGQFTPGTRRVGRPKGVPNKITSAARSAFLATFTKMEPQLEGWLERVAAEDPARAADLLIRMAEYHFPKLGRQELTGPEGGAITVQVVKQSAPVQLDPSTWTTT